MSKRLSDIYLFLLQTYRVCNILMHDLIHKVRTKLYHNPSIYNKLEEELQNNPNQLQAVKAFYAQKKFYNSLSLVQKVKIKTGKITYSQVRISKEIEAFLAEHPEILENSSPYQYIQEVRPGSLKQYAGYFASALGTVPFILNSESNE